LNWDFFTWASSSTIDEILGDKKREKVMRLERTGVKRERGREPRPKTAPRL